GLLLTWTPRPWSRRSATAVQSFGILGVLLGLSTIAIGIGPRTILDLALNATLLLTLMVGLAITLPKPCPVPRWSPQLTLRLKDSILWVRSAVARRVLGSLDHSAEA